MERVCESCGHPDEELETVQRVYVEAESWRDVDEAIAEGDIRVVDGIELWCFSCRSQYPHQPASS